MFIFLVVWSLGANWLAYRKGFYFLPPENKKEAPLITFLQLAIGFAIYLVIALFLAPLLLNYLVKSLGTIDSANASSSIALVTGVQVFSLIGLFCLLQFFFYSQNKDLLKKIWKNTASPRSKPIEFDLGLGVLTWFISFPVVTLLGELFDLFLKLFFGLQHFEQIAVKFVKQAMGSPFSLIFALFSVLVMAPLIEEFLFRGLLQTYFKKRVGARSAILLSALLFSLFHFSMSQGIGNISLIFSLFLLGGYLGFLYQRQESLWAPIGLHMTFNAISAFRILFFPEVAI